MSEPKEEQPQNLPSSAQQGLISKVLDLFNDFTKVEKVNFILSGAALLTSVLSPFVAYYWLSPQIQAFRDRPKLQVTKKIIASAKEGGPFNFMDIVTGSSYIYEVANAGPLPANNVLVTLQYIDLPKVYAEPKFDPPVLTEVVDKGTVKFITLKQPIAPQDKFTVTFSPLPDAPLPDTIYIATEYGERNIINTEAELIRRWMNMTDAQKIEIYSGNTLIQTIEKPGQAQPSPNNSSNVNK